MNRARLTAAALLVAAFLILLGWQGCSDNHGLHPVPITGISGTITFEGQWPSNTEFVRVVVYQTYPPSTLIAISAVSDPLPFGVKQYHYILPLKPGTYHWILVAWKAQNAPFTAIRTLGTYYTSGDSTQPGSVIVEQDKLIPNVDIVANFEVLHAP